MLAAIDFDTYFNLSLASGQNTRSVVDLATNLFEQTNVYAPAWERQFANILGSALGPVDRLFLVLPDEIYALRRELLAQRRQGALPILHPIRRAEAILGGLHLLEQTREVTGLVIDISFTGTSVWEIEDGFLCHDDDRPTLSLSTADLADRTAAALAGVEAFTDEDNGDADDVLVRTWEAVTLLHDPVLLGERDDVEELAAIREQCLADYAGRCTQVLEDLYGEDIDRIGTVYLTGSGAGLLASRLLPGRRHQVCTFTARDFFVGQGALAAELPFVIDIVQEWRRDRPSHRPRGGHKRK